ncbi:MAG: hypothetical protein C7B46_12825 [Sulfobacillus benefaciens]|uniref:Uncharacterized protein n=1 Tax=Sulfobacillus benefaciens TaxID=453960 RepID=A0A2T2XE58_9FIRM|nr:MAG: hypothetical protein C7B46_12825 [Sulfobacillus benefaciens]
MRRRHCTPLSASQWALFVTAGYFVSGLFAFPREVAETAGRAGLWAVAVDGVIFGGMLWATVQVQRRFPTMSLWALSPRLLGRSCGLALSGLVWLYHWAVTTVGVAEFSFIIQTYFLPQTPRGVIVGALVGTAVYMGWSGTASLARTLQGGIFPVIGLVILTAGFASLSVRHPVLLMPTIPRSWLSVAHAAEQMTILFFGIPLLVTLYPEIDPVQRRRAEWVTYGAFVGVLGWLMGLYAVLLATFGPVYVSQMRWPVVSLLRIMSVSGFWVDKIGLVALMLWTIAVAGFTSVRVHGLRSAAPVFGLNADTRTLPYASLFLGTSIVGGVLLIPNATINGWLAHHVLIPAGWAAMAGMPGLLGLVAWVHSTRDRRVRGHLPTMGR